MYVLKVKFPLASGVAGIQELSLNIDVLILETRHHVHERFMIEILYD